LYFRKNNQYQAKSDTGISESKIIVSICLKITLPIEVFLGEVSTHEKLNVYAHLRTPGKKVSGFMYIA
jgi:hypothetical protein